MPQKSNNNNIYYDQIIFLYKSLARGKKHYNTGIKLYATTCTSEYSKQVYNNYMLLILVVTTNSLLLLTACEHKQHTHAERRGQCESKTLLISGLKYA